nr:putative amidase [Quercus suber]
MLTLLVVTLLTASSLISCYRLPSHHPGAAALKDRHFPPLLDATLDDLVRGLERGLFTSVDLVRTYQARIMEVNNTLHMVTELNPDALDIAAHADSLRRNNTILSPLHGIPILIKNNIATNDAMNNTAGSFSLVGAKVGEDSGIATKLRKAGAIILGKTNLSQWANFRSSNTTNGWSAYGGQTYAAYYPGQDPSGSSSGSGVSSSLGLALAALGSETSGSILSPSDVNNLVGIKPTVGLTSRHLVIPISEHQDTVGPMARTVKDAAHVLQAIAGPDPNDNYTSAIPNNGNLPDYIAACRYDALKGARIGVAWNVLDIWRDYIDSPVIDAFHEAIAQIANAGATIVDANFTAFAQFASPNDMNGTIVLEADFVTNLRTYLDSLVYNPNNITDLSALEEFTHSFPSEDWPERDTLIWDAALSQTPLGNTAPSFWPAYQANLYYGGEGGILGALARTNTSAVLLPTQLSPSIPALVGSPVITVPMGFYPWNWTVTLNGFGNLVSTGPNVPFGLSFMGAKWSEADLIGFAYAYEQHTQHRYNIQPYITPNIELADVVRSSA